MTKWKLVALCALPLGAAACAHKAPPPPPPAPMLSAAEQASLAPAVEKLLAALTPDRVGCDRICRLCDVPRCPQARCPVELAARAIEREDAS